MGPNKERINRRSSGRPLFSSKPTPRQIADAEDLISGLHKTRAVNDEERDNLKEAVKTHKVTDPVIDVEELSKYGSKRIRNLIDVVSSSPGYVNIPVDSMGALDHALGLAEEAEAQLRGPILTRRRLLLGFGGTAVAGVLYLAFNIPQNKDQVVAVKPVASPTAPSVPVISSPSPLALPSPIPSAAPAVKIIPPGAPIAEKARLILEEDYLGPEAVEKAFGIRLTPDQIPPIQFNQGDIERAKELGEMLVLRTGNYSAGRPLTGSVMDSILGDQFFRNKKSQVFTKYSINEFANVPIENGRLFYNQSPRSGWSLVGKVLIPQSYGKSYLEQTQVLIDFLMNRQFITRAIPSKYKEAAQEFDAKIRELDDKYYKAMYRPEDKVAELKVNNIARHSFAEISYDLLLYYLNRGVRLLGEQLITTSTVVDYGPVKNAIKVGVFTEEGIVVNSTRMDQYNYNAAGVVISLT